ncbi:hypothetical protein NQZ79_g2820 [Umbelopsis isabellina]|nr:hypothetical protein NQZ79_g2820 [Umbelopsis isabellina]
MTAVPDLKAQKYDRQLRLWAASGQAALENAQVCLLNATTTGTEILKNLILPGIGAFTVVDVGVVSEKDIQRNFFLDASCMGSSKAKSTMQFLQELNVDVKANYEEKSAEYFIDQNHAFFDQFTMIIATSLNEAHALKLASICQARNTPLFLIKCVGFAGMFRIQAGEHTIIETHPENATDLRLDVPFPEILEYVKSFDFANMDSSEHGHIPFIVILQHFLQAWKSSHDGKLPETYAERNELKELIRKEMRSFDEENFEEAIANVWRLATPSKVPAKVQEIFEDPKCENVTKKSSNFWIIARAIKDFVNHEGAGLLPTPGKLPDMKSDTKSYVQLQQIYRQKALQDLEAVKARVQSLLTKSGLLPDAIDAREVEEFCKHAQYVKVIRYRSLEDELINQVHKSEILQWLEESDPINNIVHYIIFRAADRLANNQIQLVGQKEEDAAIKALEEATRHILSSMDIPQDKVTSILDNHLRTYVVNFVRYNGSELPNIASLMGGLVAQEVIKVITRQYIPIDNTCIYDGMTATTSTYDL